ncbi:hypothetical protein M758_11G005900 [Ceratodon purpureus]|uniref:Uncharacterized protein n=1 Tax=Ceratodon purpureus TaxID=3225 RepID=A0A8T0G954_CERPU|nr:hypothetical protein KC19_11G007000 [Ceratodon purpureus]KAG0600080.1 hypothetical protein M758_11G005900 [Ceratodon purpureus]
MCKPSPALVNPGTHSRSSRSAVKAGNPNADPRGATTTTKLNFAATAAVAQQSTAFSRQLLSCVGLDSRRTVTPTTQTTTSTTRRLQFPPNYKTIHPMDSYSHSTLPESSPEQTQPTITHPK